jgi:hypothetical protein
MIDCVDLTKDILFEKACELRGFVNSSDYHIGDDFRFEFGVRAWNWLNFFNQTPGGSSIFLHMRTPEPTLCGFPIRRSLILPPGVVAIIHGKKEQSIYWFYLKEDIEK